MALASPNFIPLGTELVPAFLVVCDDLVQGFPVKINPLLPGTSKEGFDINPAFGVGFQPNNPGFMAKDQGEEFPGGPD